HSLPEKTRVALRRRRDLIGPAADTRGTAARRRIAHGPCYYRVDRTGADPGRTSQTLARTAFRPATKSPRILTVQTALLFTIVHVLAADGSDLILCEILGSGTVGRKCERDNGGDEGDESEHVRPPTVGTQLRGGG